ncbi:hypothetical protein D3C78_1404880 [compost metagenome]
MNDIGKGVVGAQLHLELGVGRKDVGELRPEQGINCVLRSGNANGASRHVTELDDVLQLRFDVLVPRSDHGE